MRKRVTIGILIANTIFILLISSISFYISYNALRELSFETVYQSNEINSYLWPLLIDFSLVAFSLFVINAQLLDLPERRQWYLITIFILLTITFNLIHAPNNLLAKFIAVIPPLSLVFSFEIFASQLRHLISKSIETEVKQPEVKVKLPENKLSKYRPDKRIRLEQLIKIYKPDKTPAKLAKELDVSVQTIETYLSELKNLGYLNE